MASMDQLPHQKNFPLLLSSTNFPLYPYFITLLSDSYVPHLEMTELAQEKGESRPLLKSLFILLYHPISSFLPAREPKLSLAQRVTVNDIKLPEKQFGYTNTLSACVSILSTFLESR